MATNQLSLKSNIVYQNIVSKEKKIDEPKIYRYILTCLFHCCTVSQNSLCVTSKLAQITVERENGCLGLTLRGGGDLALIVTNVRPHGPVFKVNRIKPGDRLLRVDNVSTAKYKKIKINKAKYFFFDFDRFL